MIFMDNFHREDYSEPMRCSIAYYLSPGIPDGPLDRLLQFRIQEGMVEHGESSNQGDRLENCQRSFPLPGCFSSRPDYISRSVLPYGNIPVSLGIPDFPYDRFCREHNPQVTKCPCRVSRCRSVQKRIRGDEEFSPRLHGTRPSGSTSLSGGYREGPVSCQEVVRCRTPCHSSIPGCLNRQ